MHFIKNNEFRRRGNRAVARSDFMSFQDFTNPKALTNN
jgi:hypothetical protein